MFKTILGGKIHRATITEADLNYSGSITVDSELLKLCNIEHNEQVHVFNITNGNRLITYALEGEAKGRKIQINGAAAKLVNVGDLVIIASFISIEAKLIKTWQPKVIILNKANDVIEQL